MQKSASVGGGDLALGRLSLGRSHNRQRPVVFRAGDLVTDAGIGLPVTQIAQRPLSSPCPCGLWDALNNQWLGWVAYRSLLNGPVLGAGHCR